MEESVPASRASVTYREEIRIIEMDQELEQAYTAFAQEVTASMQRLSAQENISGLIPWLRALLIYPDMPWLGWECRTLPDHLGSAPALPKHHVYPVEKALINYVQEQLTGDLPTIVFSENSELLTNDHDRLKALFERFLVTSGGKVPRIAIMCNEVSWWSRAAWVHQRTIQEHIHILICDPVRVDDLDLTYFKRVAFKRVPAARRTLQMAARCLCTPGQDGPVETVFFAYAGSLALRLLNLHMRQIFSTAQALYSSTGDTPQRGDEYALMQTARDLAAEIGPIESC
jgi:hypothetical protein